MTKTLHPTMSPPVIRANDATLPAPRPDVIALRKTCDAEGTGLSHYVLMDKQVTR